MSWLRLDDKFVRHPKITRLVRNDRWTWLEVLSYCSEYKTEGWVPETIKEVVPKATTGFLITAYEAGLLDVSEDQMEFRYRVHDWDIYNPKDPLKAERMARYREKKASTPASTDTSTQTSPVDENDRLQNRLRDGAPARAGARAPVPSPSKGDEGRESSMDAAPPARNGREPLSTERLKALATYAHDFWDEYPSTVDLRLELTDRGATEAQAVAIIEDEQAARSKAAA